MKILNRYSFLPWLRHGLANNITNSESDANVKLRAVIEVELGVEAQKADGSKINQSNKHPVQIYGPGDIQGIENKAIIKMEPRNGITNFEPNYFPYIEFYDEDFAWRYTPAASSGNRLRPWLTLVVLEDKVEFGNDKMGIDQPLPSFTLKPGVNIADVFPSYDQLWAWAHVHMNKDLGGPGSDPENRKKEAVLPNLQQALKEDPDNGYCRIICPRRLEPLKSYCAFLIPTFETGRLTGLGLKIPAATPANQSAWKGQSQFPYYHRWYFGTGTTGDFEYLVTLLKPKPADSRVGIRDMDVIHPGSNLPPISTPADLDGILRLGGALRIPEEFQDQTEFKKFDEWDEHPYPHPFEVAMAARINLEDDYQALDPTEINPDGDEDPIITSPLYGRWHAAVSRLLKERDGTDIPNNNNWIHELNLDPRFRVPAGFGTNIIKKHQEEYMHAAWEQLGDVLTINHIILLAQLAIEVSDFIYTKHFTTMSADKKILFTAPLQKRIVLDGKTVFNQVQNSTVPYAATTAAFRKVTRPRGSFLKQMNKDVVLKPESLVTRLAEGTVVAAPPKAAPAGAIKLAVLKKNLAPKNIPGFIKDLLTRQPLSRFIPLICALTLLLALILTGGAGLVMMLLFIAISAVAYALMQRWYKQLTSFEQTAETNQTPAAVDALPKSPDFTITQPGATAPAVHFGTTDSVEAVKFKRALKDAYSFVSVDFAEPVKTKLDVARLAENIHSALDPRKTIPHRTLANIHLPPSIRDQIAEYFAPVMKYPKIDLPMYLPLSILSPDLFLPNINLIENNSICLLEMNEKFIEAYMAGLNHEMSRELLWREYPTDQRGSYFRQFWDVSSVYTGNPPPKDEKESLRDIKEMHTWSKHSNLGQQNNRIKADEAPPVVLVIRGELLKKYPNTVIYAQKSAWVKNKHGELDATINRTLVELTPAEEKDPPKTKMLTPMLEAVVAPDIYFFGFNLTAKEVFGGEKTTEDPGWFFVLKERPGEARFGLDEEDKDPKLPKLYNWNKLAWDNTGTAPGKCLAIDKNLPIVPEPTDANEQDKHHPEDDQAFWNTSTDAAQLAYILYQVPMMVAVHGSKMLLQANPV